MFRVLSLLLLIFYSGALQAQKIWSEIAEHEIPLAGERLIIPQHYKTIRLDQAALQALLSNAPERFTPAAQKNDLPVLTIPMPDGRMSRFRLAESPVMAPALQAKYPEIRCYTGRGIDDPTALLKCDLTPKGFHAMVLSSRQGTVYLDPYSQGDMEHYVVYFKKDYWAKNDDLPFVCETETDDLQEIISGESAAKVQGDCQLRTYRLALACTGEYAFFHGGTKASALAAMNTTMNRVSGVYENDFAVTFQIIANNDLIIYLNGATDPYSNGNASAMLGENQTTCNNVIGAANYDIGHVFGTNSGGIASLNVVCGNNKARGVTGNNSPVGDPFDIDYVAHEMGHQFGGSHTFNGTAGSCGGNASANNAVEPGSGTTVMAYAGICGAHNIQSNSDDYFHARSVQQINNFTINGNGNNCPVKTPTGNNNPVVDGGPDRTIPKSTPFALTATGSDADGDTLTYCWDQMDAAVTTSPPVATSATGPLFRSFKGTTSPTRYFPRLSDLVNNTNYPWEKLPGVARTMNFRVVLRDNNGGAGCTDEDDVVVTVTGSAGPFVVTEPNTNVLWYVGESKTVTWNVANTDLDPVNCAAVRILLSTDGGFTYPVVLAENVPNTGSATVSVPNNVANTCRVKVAAVGNIFFDISNQNFRIELPPVPTFTLAASAGALEACAGDTVSFSTNIGSILGFSDPVQLTLSGAPAGTTIQVNPNPATPGSSAVISIYDLSPAMAGNYTLGIEGNSGSIVQNTTVPLNLLPGAPEATTAVSPPDGAVDQSLTATLTWTIVPFAQNYTIEVATNPSFSAGSIVAGASVSGNSFQTPALQAGGVYYWRVRSTNPCGESEFTEVRAFQAGNISCDHIFASLDVPKSIAAANPDTIKVVSVLNVQLDKIISDVELFMQANHTYVGDLDARLIAPDGTEYMLFDRPGVPASPDGCSGNNLFLTFDDEAILTAPQLEAACNSPSPALIGTYQPIDLLSDLHGQSAQGEWKLAVNDYADGDGGSLNTWSLDFCLADIIPTGVLAANHPLSVPTGGNGVVANANLALTLSGGALQGKYTLLSLPQHGTLTLNGATLAFGDSFTQADIDANLLVYNHSGDTAMSDYFLFDAVDLNNFAWVHNETFTILIVQNNLAATAEQTQAVLCNNSATGQITVTATGLDGQYQYSLNGGPNQASNVFIGLPTGTYTVVVTGQFGYTATSNEVVLLNPPALQVSANVNADDITVSATGGTGTLEYSLDGVDFQASNLFEDLPNGFYTVTVRDENGCTASAMAIVAVNSLLANLGVQVQISCFGGNDGVIVATVAGGQAPYAYSLNGGAFQPENTFSGLPAGTYSVEVKDNQGFTIATNEVTLTNPPAISASASVALNVITVTASGGTGTLEYSLNGVNFQSGNTFGNLVNGNYTVTVRDENGCTATAPAQVNVPPLTVTAIESMQPILCFGDLTGILVVNVIGGIPPYEYSLNNGSFQSSNTFTGVGGGQHVIKVRDAAGSVVEAPLFILSQPAQLAAQVTVNGNDAQFSASGGTQPYLFSFNGPMPPVNLPNGNYSVTATDANGCTDVENFSVNLPPLTLTGEITNIEVCDGVATIEMTASGGEPPYEFSLNGGPFQSSPVFTIFSGNNSVRVRDATGTIVQIPVPIQLNPPVEISADVFTDTIITSAQSGTPPYEFAINGMPFQSSPVFPNLPNGSYTVVVEDANGCTDTVMVMVIAVVEPAKAWGLVVSPNPSAGLFRLAMEQAPAELRADVFDATGRMLRTLHFTPGGGQFSATLNLQDLPQGSYLLRLTDGQNSGGVRLSIVR